jgi:hypothetical protein
MTSERKPIRTALVRSYAGSVAVALLLLGALQAMVVAVRDPIELVVSKSLNFLLLQSRTYETIMPESRPSTAGMSVFLILSVLLFGCGLWLGTWLHPSASSTQRQN